MCSGLAGVPYHTVKCFFLQEGDNLFLLVSESPLSKVPAEPRYMNSKGKAGENSSDMKCL